MPALMGRPSHRLEGRQRPEAQGSFQASRPNLPAGPVTRFADHDRDTGWFETRGSIKEPLPRMTMAAGRDKRRIGWRHQNRRIIRIMLPLRYYGNSGRNQMDLWELLTARKSRQALVTMRPTFQAAYLGDGLRATHLAS